MGEDCKLKTTLTILADIRGQCESFVGLVNIWQLTAQTSYLAGVSLMAVHQGAPD
jgi:hypothetical protein